MGLVVGFRRSRLRVIGLFGFGALLGAFALGALSIPTATQGDAATINGTEMSGTFTVSSPIYDFGFVLSPSLQANVASFSCGQGSTTDSTGGPNGNSFECSWTTPVETGAWVFDGNEPWPDSVTITPFVSTDNQTYVEGAPDTITAASPAPTPTPTPVAAPTTPPVAAPTTPPVATPTPTPTPTPSPVATPTPTPRSAANEPKININISGSGSGSGNGSPLFWVPVGVGIGFVIVGGFGVRNVEAEVGTETPDGKKGRYIFDPTKNEFIFKADTVLHTVGLMTRDTVLHTAGVLPGTMAMDTPCLAEQAAVAAAQAAEAAARLEFEAAKAALDEAERQNNLGQTEESYQALKAAANRQGAGRLNLEIAEKHLDEAEKALAACLG